MATSKTCDTMSMELKMNFATGYLLSEERKKIRDETKEQSDLGEKKFVVKTSEWLLTEVFAEMKKYEDGQNKMDDQEEKETEEEEEEEEEEMEENEEESEQRKWISDIVVAMLTDYDYEVAAMRVMFKKEADQALQVNNRFYYFFSISIYIVCRL